MKIYWRSLWFAALLLIAGSGLFLPAAFASSPAQSPGAVLVLLNRQGSPVTRLTDGDHIRLRLELTENVSGDSTVDFLLDGISQPVGSCFIQAGQRGCESSEFPALGWYWTSPGQALPTRTLSAALAGSPVAALQISIASRPVVLVHGFISTYAAWANYLGPSGYLAGDGLPGYAVGDGQVEGTLNTGSLDKPATRTNTIAQNAAELGQYIDNVRKKTGAEQVDLLVHSMGGLISRYYIDKVMVDDAVAQLVILGTPMAGSACANLPASLGLYLPASIEIQPSYITGIFNPAITHRRGTPFYAMAGTPILDVLKAPCTDVPTDLVVSENSASAIPLAVEQKAVLHIDMNTSPQVYAEFVRPHLQAGPQAFAEAPDPPAAGTPPEPLQFSRVFTGTVPAGGSQELVIPIDNGVAVANFSLFDPSRSLTSRVIGASGKEVILDTEKNGLFTVDDPAAMLHLGYGFRDPRPGTWRVILEAGADTPPEGARFALAAKYLGGATLHIDAAPLLPRLGEAVLVGATLDDPGQTLTVLHASASLRQPDGSVRLLELTQAETAWQASWLPEQTGLHHLIVNLQGRLPDGVLVDRAASLAIEAQPPLDAPQRTLAFSLILTFACAIFIFLALAALGFWLYRRKRR